MQGREDVPDAWLDVETWASGGLDRVNAGDELLVITWLHQARRDVLQVHPRSDRHQPLTGVFATRSPDRPNPLRLHPGAAIVTRFHFDVRFGRGVPRP